MASECAICQILFDSDDLIVQPNGMETCEKCTQLAMNEAIDNYDGVDFTGSEVSVCNN